MKLEIERVYKDNKILNCIESAFKPTIDTLNKEITNFNIQNLIEEVGYNVGWLDLSKYMNGAIKGHLIDIIRAYKNIGTYNSYNVLLKSFFGEDSIIVYDNYKAGCLSIDITTATQDKAIQTKDSIILLDEISRAHPEAWNILMTVLDQGQRYLRLDEHPDAPTIPVAEGVTFIATANIGNEYTATRAMDRALVDRFVIMEMESLSKDDESTLLFNMYPTLPLKICETIAEIASITRADVRSENPKLTTSISTRLSVELAGLIADGFSLEEGAEVAIYPFFDADGGVDSERVFMKQLIQKYGAGDDADIFNAEQQETPTATPF